MALVPDTAAIVYGESEIEHDEKFYFKPIQNITINTSDICSLFFGTKEKLSLPDITIDTSDLC